MAENMIPRKYNYNLETGTVGTDNEDIANILYNINRMEMKAEYTASDLEGMRKTFGDAFFLAVDSGVHFENFMEMYKEKLNASDVQTAQNAIDDAIKILGAVEPPQEDIDLMSVSIKDAYKKALAVVPNLLQLEEQVF